MIRKETPKQNDISIIIGNLPKRLQRKIAEGAREAASVQNDAQNGMKATAEWQVCASKQKETNAKMEDNLLSSHCDRVFFANVVEPNGNGFKAATSREAKTSGVHRSIPGILRLKPAEAKKLIDAAEPIKPAAKRENGRRSNAHAQQRRENIVRAALVNTDVRPSHRKIAHPNWFDESLLPFAEELKQLYEELITMMQKNDVLKEWNIFCNVRTQLQHIFKQLLLNCVAFCFEQKVDTFFWKLLFYNVREYLKQQPISLAPNYTISLLEDGLRFYTDLYNQLRAKYLAHNGERCQDSAHKFERIAKIMAQKLLIYLGDLSRYRVKLLHTNDYSEAAKYYQEAQRLLPSNAVPYNQLAIVAMLANMDFDAIYFHIRSLMSSNVIISAKESLLVLFDDIRKKYEETESKTSPLRQKPISSSSCSKSMRKEVWIYPDGIRRLHRAETNSNKSTANEENRLKGLKPVELDRCFTSLFLYITGKLYTGIGMESINEHQRKLLILLKVILQRRGPLLFERSRILKMVAMNIFVLYHNISQDSRREIRYYAFDFGNQIFGFMLRKCNQLFTKYTDEVEVFEESSFADLNTLLQFVKIYADWLTLNVHIWEPIRSEENCLIDCWAELQRLFLLIQNLQSQKIEEHKNQQQIVLEEDAFFEGFKPLSPKFNTNDQCNTRAFDLSENAQFYPRLREILKFQIYFAEYKKSLHAADESHFELEELNSSIKSVLDELQSSEENSHNIAANGLTESISGVESELTNVTLSDDDAQVTQLSKLKKELEAKTNEKKMYHAKLEEILNYVDTKVYIEVRPKYLLPDTNCFIDGLENFEKLSEEFKHYYTLMVPLTVVKELDGLSKGVKFESRESVPKHRIHHYDDVSTCARKSLDFIKAKKNNVKCVTTKGSNINPALFALVEEEYVSNDDKILATALTLSKTMSNETSKGGKCFIQTELVLITTDRNLRVKALSRNLAVSDLNEFLQWAKDCNT